MAKIDTPHRFMSTEEYLELEKDAPVRHEYIDGRLFPRAAVTRRHSLIAGNIVLKLAHVTGKTSYQVYVSAVKVRTPADSVYYPDVMVVREPDGGDEDVVLEPCLIVEVASPGTMTRDGREKLAAYQSIPSLNAYLLVDQDRRRVERYHRDEDGGWLHATLIGDSSVPVPCPETDLLLADIYEGP